MSDLMRLLLIVGMALVVVLPVTYIEEKLKEKKDIEYMKKVCKFLSGSR